MIPNNRKYIALIATGVVAAAGIYWFVGRKAQPTSRQIRGAIGQTVDGSVLTGSYDNARTNAYLLERLLTPATVRPASFGKLFSLAVDGEIYAQPLYMQGLSMAAGAGQTVRRNVVFVATMHNTLYAFDADVPGMPLWSTNFGPAARTSAWVTEHGPYTDIQPENGILGTPVIDHATGTIYAVAATLENGVYTFRLHAVDAATGAQRPGSPVTLAAEVEGKGAASVNGRIAFDAAQHLQRLALLLHKGVVYAAFGSHGDMDPYHGWLLGYSAANVQQQVSVFNPTPGGDRGAFWQSGRGPAVDDDGNILLIAGNGASDQTTNFGSSILRLDAKAGAVADFFTPFDFQELNDSDSDLTAGPVVIPGTKLVLGSGKAGVIYLLDRTNMGHMATNDVQIVQRLDTGGPLIFNVALWNRPDGPVLYSHSVNAPITAYKLLGGKLGSKPFASSRDGFPVPYQGMALSADGYLAGTGVLWVLAPINTPRSPAVLRAYNADGLEEIWNSRMNEGDEVGRYMKFTNPTVANGKVYVATGSNQLVVYGATSKRTAADKQTPVITGVVNAASYRSGALAPGEIVAVLGLNLGPKEMVSGTAGANGRLGTELAGLKVLFNGVAGPIYTASAGLVTVSVPYEVAGADRVTVQLIYGTWQAAPLTLALADSAPGLFTMDSTGSGPGAFLNEDGSLNTPENPAKAGSVVVLNGTGGGLTQAPSTTGALVTEPNPLAGTVTVMVGGKPATVISAENAVGAVAGAIQVKIRLPAEMTAGPASVVLTVGSQASPATVTVAVE